MLVIAHRRTAHAARQPALLGVAHLPARDARFGFNRTTPGPVPRRSGQKASRSQRCSAVRCWLRRSCSWNGLAAGGGYGRGACGSPSMFLMALGLAGIHRPALQPLLAARGPGAAPAHRRAAEALRLCRQGCVRRGQLAPLEPRQRLLHRHRPAQAHRVLRYAARSVSLTRKSRRCWRTSSAISASSTCASGLLLSIALSFVGLALLGWLTGQAGFYAALGVPVASTHAAAAAVRAGGPGLHLSSSPQLASLWSRRHEFQADAFATRHASAAELATAARQTASGQRQHSDTRSGVCGRSTIPIHRRWCGSRALRTSDVPAVLRRPARQGM